MDARIWAEPADPRNSGPVAEVPRGIAFAAEARLRAAPELCAIGLCGRFGLIVKGTLAVPRRTWMAATLDRRADNTARRMVPNR